MVGVAQLVRAPGCGPGGRGFKSHHSPIKISGYSVVRLTRLLWEQEIGSSNLSTPTLEKTTFLSIKALSMRQGFLFIYIQTYSYIPQLRTRQLRTHCLYPTPTDSNGATSIGCVRQAMSFNYKYQNQHKIFKIKPTRWGTPQGKRSSFKIMLLFRLIIKQVG